MFSHLADVFYTITAEYDCQHVIHNFFEFFQQLYLMTKKAQNMGFFLLFHSATAV